MYAHVGALPLEETALGLVPIAAVAVGRVLQGATRVKRTLQHLHLLHLRGGRGRRSR
ncbi:MAG TPA: hypothetical protein VF504_00950 [Solirubrobacterales bacterium]|jgi:hypothetical protein